MRFIFRSNDDEFKRHVSQELNKMFKASQEDLWRLVLRAKHNEDIEKKWTYEDIIIDCKIFCRKDK